MKKEKTNFRQSENEKGALTQSEKELPEGLREKAKGIKVLVPLLSKREAEPAFIKRAVSGAHEIILLLAIDTNAMAGQFGFATTEIASGNALMQKMKVEIGKKRKTCVDVIEWGDTETKIGHLALLDRVDRIYLVKQDNLFFKKLVKSLREKLEGVEIEEVQLPGWDKKG